MAVGTSRKISAASARAHTRKPKRKASVAGFSGHIFLDSINTQSVVVVSNTEATRPPPPKTCGSPDGPPITASRIQLNDGRHLAYKEYGVPKDEAKYKIIFIHGFGCCRHDISVITSNLSPDLVESQGIRIVSFDRAGYGESDPNPKQTVKSTAFDIEELADKLGLGSKFYLVGFSMGGQLVWTCLKYIPHRLAGAALLTPVVNYWWPGLPSNLTKEAYDQQPPQDQWAVRAQVRQQGDFVSLHRDLMIGFGTWEFDPTGLENPFSESEGSVHLWQGDDDKLVLVTPQRYIAQKLPWIQYHELPGAGHLFPYADGMADLIIKTLLAG
ncbi:Alpha beta-Hydrolases superfamily [Olea europaea subsp. europaea]|uniref:Alpha beta-Hydrolases superfamily n=1 Tax=Olea europaea subsp. europaea TaxID=158383 RepID=A0A8S0UGZ1_OLEEU|nr:Alpha beta-Hydrolases superfamily [Olea europaea subsp. europaea]